MKPFVTSFRVPVYGSRVYVGVAPNSTTLAKVLPRKLKYEPENGARGELTNYHNGTFLLALFQVTPNTIGHELDHLTGDVLRYHEVRRDTEASAYLCGELHERVYKILDRNGVKVAA